MKTRILLHLIGGAVLSWLAAGCATQRVWNGANERVTCAPAPQPDVALFETRDRADVLVQYNALKPRNQTVERRAYFLSRNQSRLLAGQKPHFVSPGLAARMTPIPVFTNSAAGARTRSASRYAVVARDGRQFIIHRAGAPPEACSLPEYADHSDLGRRAALTPFAVAADAAVLGAVVFLQGAGSGLISGH